MANAPTAFVDNAATTARGAEVSGASFTNGMNWGASNACGIGIATDVPDLTGDPSGFTLLDQEGNARTPQTSQYIGGSGLDGGVAGGGTAGIDVASPSATGDGTATSSGKAHLVTLAAGWSAV